MTQLDLHDYIAIARKRWMSILLMTALVVAAVMTATLLTTPTYQASSGVFVSVNNGGSTSDLLSGASFSQDRVTSYTAMVTSPRVLIPVIARLGLHTTPDKLAASITATSAFNTVLIDITVTNTNPKIASDVANATADSLATQVSALERPAANQPSPVRVSTLRTATVPTAPATPKPTQNLALGLVLGLLFGVGLALLREVLDTKVRSEIDRKSTRLNSSHANISYAVFC